MIKIFELIKGRILWAKKKAYISVSLLSIWWGVSDLNARPAD